jgi:hypothetical protein
VTSKSDQPAPTPKKGVSRRTVVAGTAWAVPAVIVATATPAFAALSGPVTFTGVACKDPGNPFRYLFSVTITNSNNQPLQVNFQNLVINGVTGTSICPTSATVPANGSITVTLIAGGFTNSANGTATLNYTFGPVGGPYVAGQASTQFNNDIPPLQNPSCTLSIPAGCTV